MPSKSAKQARFMSAVAHDKEFADKVGVPQAVGREFHGADKKRGGLHSAGIRRKKKEASPILKHRGLGKRRIESLYPHELDRSMATGGIRG